MRGIVPASSDAMRAPAAIVDTSKVVLAHFRLAGLRRLWDAHWDLDGGLVIGIDLIVFILGIIELVIWIN